MGMNLWKVSEVYITSITKHVSEKNETKYFKLLCRIEGKMISLNLFDDERKFNPYKRMEKALATGSKFQHLKKAEMESALAEDKSEYFNMLITKKIPVDLEIRVNGYGDSTQIQYGYNVVDWGFSDSLRARKLVVKSLVPPKEREYSTEKMEDLSAFGI